MVKSFALSALLAPALIAQAPKDTVVRNVGRPVHAGVATLTREISIGVADGDEHYMLGGVGDAAVAPNGTIYVFDRTVPTIRVYDANGKYVTSIGRKGSGPGEYQSAASVAVAKDGNILVYDPGLARINVYAPNGDVVTQFRTDPSGSGTASGKGMLKVDVNGDIYIFRYFIAGRATEPKAGWLRFRADGTLRDTLYEAAGAKDETLSWFGGGQMMTRGVPFMASMYTRISPLGYLVTARNDRIAMDLHPPDGSIISIRRPTTPVPVSAHERDSARADIIAEFHKVAPQWSWNAAEIPKFKRIYEWFGIDADGRIWVELQEGPHKDDPFAGDNVVMTSSKVAGTTPKKLPGGFGSSCPETGWKLYDVFEPAGRYLGQVKSPERIEMMVMRGDFVWASTCTADDVPAVVRYRIAWR